MFERPSVRGSDRMHFVESTPWLLERLLHPPGPPVKLHGVPMWDRDSYARERWHSRRHWQHIPKMLVARPKSAEVPTSSDVWMLEQTVNCTFV
mmetsp:Transcript_84791/g.197190  ORF Transcript_84791/g.197190 Transcript_84791/m.197190 type:complete len:93 (-) Transcript_84791:15-293(-)